MEEKIIIISAKNQDSLNKFLEDHGDYKVISNEEFFTKQWNDDEFWKKQADLASQDKERAKEIALWDKI